MGKMLAKIPDNISPLEELRYFLRYLRPSRPEPSSFLEEKYTQLLRDRGNELSGERAVNVGFLAAKELNPLYIEAVIRRKCKKNELSFKLLALMALMDCEESTAHNSNSSALDGDFFSFYFDSIKALFIFIFALIYGLIHLQVHREI